MIKLSVTGFGDLEFKKPKNIFLWVSLTRGSDKDIRATITFHNTREEAIENKYLKTDKQLEMIANLPPLDFIVSSESLNGNGWKAVEKSIHKEIASQIENLKLSNVTKIEVL